MFARLAFLFAMCLGLAVAPVRSVGACAQVEDATSCHSCCAVPNAGCCEVSGTAPAPDSSAKPAPSTSQAKQLAPPALVLLSFTAPPAVKPPRLFRQHATRIPGLPLIEKTCIRLI